MKKIFFFYVLNLFALQLRAQSFAINTDGSSANNSALLDVKSNAKGVLIPRMHKTEKNAIVSPATGLLIFQNAPDSVGFYYFNGSSWLWLATVNNNNSNWTVQGNNGTDTATHFLGTNDNMPLRLKQNNQWIGQLNSNSRNYFIGGGAGKLNNTGNSNTGFGDSVLYQNNGDFNTAVGAYALKANKTGIRNVAMGYNAMMSNMDGFDNIGIGFSPLSSLVTGRDNIAIGAGAGGSNDTLNNIVCIGTGAGGLNQRDRIVAIGYGALFSNGISSTNSNEGKENTAVGFNSMFQSRTGSRNTGVGYAAMQGTVSGISGSNNIAIGDSTLTGITSGSSNIAVGNNALGKNSTGWRNVAVGDSALYTQSFNGGVNYFMDNTALGSKALFFNQPNSAVSGIKNTAVGSEALYFNSIGFENTAVGTGAMHDNISGYRNTVLGRSANRNAKIGIENTYLGFESGFSDSLGFGNTAIGSQTMHKHRTGGYNVAVGYLALQNDTVGTGKTAIGTAALFSDQSTTLPNTAVGYAAFTGTAGNGNTGLGYLVGAGSGSGSRNTLVGYEVAPNNSNGNSITAIGFMAAHSNINNSNIVAIGDSALFANTLSNNMAIGSQSLRNLNSTSFNTALGRKAGYSLVNGANNTYAGDQAGYYANNNNECYIGFKSGFLAVSNAGNNTFVGANIAANGTVPTNHNLYYNTVMGAFAGFNMRVSNMNSYFGTNTALNDTSGHDNAGMGALVFSNLTNGNFNTAIGSNAGKNIITGSSNTFLGYFAAAGTGNLSNATAIGANAMVNSNNALVLGSINGINSATANTNVGIGTISPAARLDVAADFKMGAFGSINTALIKNTQNVNIAGIAANSELDITLTVANASVTNSAVFVSPAADIEPGLVIAWARVSAANTVKIRVKNTTAALINPAAVNYTITILQ